MQDQSKSAPITVVIALPIIAASVIIGTAGCGPTNRNTAATTQLLQPVARSQDTIQNHRVARDLSTARLLKEKAPTLQHTPILRKLVDSQWSPEGNLAADIQPMIPRIGHWRPVKCYRVKFTSHNWRGDTVRIFGYYGYPAFQGGDLPALLLVHGGGGYATIGRTLDAAGRGYAALAIDLPGGGSSRKTHSRSTGPDMTVRQIFTVKPTLKNNYIYNAVIAQMRAVTFLRSRPEVDPENIGLVGVSWGGATGLITTAVDTRISCFVDMFGSGFLRGGSTWHEYFDQLPADEFDTWERHFDASRYVENISVPILGVTGTNDNCYYLPRFMRTLRIIQPTPDIILRPNLRHRIDRTARTGYFKWLDHKLRQKDTRPVPRLHRMTTAVEKGCVQVRLKATDQSPPPIRADVCYGKVGNVGWTNRTWHSVQCRNGPDGDWWYADIPLESPLTYVYASAYWEDGSALSTPVHTIAMARIDGKAFALDAPFIYKGPQLLIEAHRFAQLEDAQITPLPQNNRIRLTHANRTVTCSGRRVGHLLFVGLRSVVEPFGGIVHFDGMKVILQIPENPPA